MNSRRVTRIRASAGSGKTFQLTSRYLALVQGGVDPARILATTFSRAAAAEIRDRVLRRAADAVLDAGKRRELADALELDLGAAEAATLLERIVRGLPRMQVRTLDSFFAGVVSAFPVELGHGSAPRVLDDGEERTLLLDAIRLAMEDEDETAFLQTILSLVRGKRVAAVVRAAEDELKDLLDVAAESDDVAWEWPEPTCPGEDETRRLRGELQGILDRKAGDGHLMKAVRSHILKLDSALEIGGDLWHSDRFGKIVASALEGGDVMFRNKPLPDDVAETYRRLARVLVCETERGYARMTAAMRTLALGVGPRRARIARERAVVTFADLTALLDPRSNPQPELLEVWFRLDGRIQHLLLDEFQDTSVVQWRALQRMVEEIVAGGEDERSLFVVGDGKQAIYGWRGGEPRLLTELPVVLRESGEPVELHERELVTSYRSSQSVIGFVNAVFGGLTGHQGECEVETHAVERWVTQFKPHSTKRELDEGFVEVVAVPFGPGPHPDKKAPLNFACQRVIDVRRRRPGATIGVIVRSNAAVATIARRLQQQGHAVRVIGRGALLDREASLAVLQALRLAEWPGDSMAAFDLAHSPLASIVGFDAEPTGARPSADVAASVSRGLRRRFERDGIAATIDGWRRELVDQLDDHEQLRLEQMVAVVDRLAAAADRTPGDIAALAMEARVESVAGGEIAVMTVHQSKGLEFDAVIVTDIEGKLEGNTSLRRLAWESPARPADPIPRVVRWLRKPLRKSIPLMGAVCDDSLARQIEESLSILYVALTRAREELTVVVSSHQTTKTKEASSKSTGTLAAIVRAATAQPEVRLEPEESERTILTMGAPTSRAARATPVATVVRAGTVVSIHPAPHRARRVRPASAHEDRATMFRLRDRDALDRGTAFHAALATIGFLDAADPDRVALATAIREALPSRADEWLAERAGEVCAALARPNLRALLSRRDPGTEARTEHGFVQLTTAGVVEGSIDRLTLERDERGEICGATVIDYKTDSIPADLVGELAVRYGEQVRAYGRLVAEQFGLAPSAVRLGLFALEHDVLVDVSDLATDDPSP